MGSPYQSKNVTWIHKKAFLILCPFFSKTSIEHLYCVVRSGASIHPRGVCLALRAVRPLRWTVWRCRTAPRVWVAAGRRWIRGHRRLIPTSRPARSAGPIITWTTWTTAGTTTTTTICTAAIRWDGPAAAPFYVKRPTVVPFEWRRRLRRPSGERTRRWPSLWRLSTTTGRRRWGPVSAWRIRSPPCPLPSDRPSNNSRRRLFPVNRLSSQLNQRHHHLLRRSITTNGRQFCNCLLRHSAGPAR